MDSHTFRILAAELVRLLEGARLEKVHGPVPGLYAFVFFADGRKRRLLFRFERQQPLLLFSALKPENPPASVMRIRKYCQGRRFGSGRVDFVARQAAFPVAGPLSGTAQGSQVWLVLDLAAGAAVQQELPPDFGQHPVWPGPDVTDALCGIPWQKRQKDGPWQQWAVLTPFLRETLAALDPMEGRALMIDLEAGGGGLYLYADGEGRPALYSAWPLPDEVLRRRDLAREPLLCGGHDAALAFAAWQAPAAELLPDFPALACATLADEPKLFAALGETQRKREERPERKADKKTARLLARLEQEEQRLTRMLALRDEAKLLQGELWRHAADARLDSVEAVDAEGKVRRIALDPLISLRENMQRMFKQSARGARGLAMLEERRNELLRAAGRGGASAIAAPDGRMPGPGKDAGQVRPDGENGGIPAGAARPVARSSEASGPVEHPFTEGRNAPRGVGRYLSSDGFILLRGKNAKGNQTLMKLGKGHDLWLHAEDGPSAHLVIRRSHAAEEVPERTLLEAAAMVAEKSWQSGDAKAWIMVALMKHVHPVKGGSPGQARVDQILRSLIVAVRPDEAPDKQPDERPD